VEDFHDGGVCDDARDFHAFADERVDEEDVAVSRLVGIEANQARFIYAKSARRRGLHKSKFGKVCTVPHKFSV
jgi:hypothetical protein